jgi:dTDP-4-amino-4,6-dideoxygalactose transaminase
LEFLKKDQIIDYGEFIVHEIKKIKNIRIITTHHDYFKSSRHLFQIVVDNRNKFMELLNSIGIYPGVHHGDNTNYKMYNYRFGQCPNSHYIYEKLI